MSSKYDGIPTAAGLVAEVQAHGLSMNQDDICRAQDIFGNTPVVELARLANDIGRNNEKGEPDPEGTWSSGRKATQGAFYMIISNIWNWEEVTRFWNQYTNPEHKELLELRSSRKDLEERMGYLAEDVKTEHDLLLAETSEKLKLKEEVERLQAELHYRDMEVMKLKSKLYDLLIDGKEAA